MRNIARLRKLSNARRIHLLPGETGLLRFARNDVRLTNKNKNQGAHQCPPPPRRRNRSIPSASLHAESLGLAPGRGRLAGRRIIVVGAGQRNIVDEEPPIGNGRAMSVLFAREGAHVACVDINKEAADDTVAQITCEGGKAFTDIVDVVRRLRDRARGRALRKTTRRARRAGAQCRDFLRPVAAENDGGSLGQGLRRQRAQPHAVRAKGAGSNGAGRRDHADIIDGKPARQWPQPGL